MSDIERRLRLANDCIEEALEQIEKDEALQAVQNLTIAVADILEVVRAMHDTQQKETAK